MLEWEISNKSLFFPSEVCLFLGHLRSAASILLIKSLRKLSEFGGEDPDVTQQMSKTKFHPPQVDAGLATLVVGDSRQVYLEATTKQVR